MFGVRELGKVILGAAVLRSSGCVSMICLSTRLYISRIH